MMIVTSPTSSPKKSYGPNSSPPLSSYQIDWNTSSQNFGKKKRKVHQIQTLQPQSQHQQIIQQEKRKKRKKKLKETVKSLKDRKNLLTNEVASLTKTVDELEARRAELILACTRLQQQHHATLT
eukprot:TRINITY_DN210_c0_g1_i3.p1 TRINITY_DN210_c0_g1~~TRINITY_DN210_c0_g1_i3.p1  ORF type:complete len:124 (+),score=36.57 TRINITY_DN210_c0_g1_i3:354-725(+)